MVGITFIYAYEIFYIIQHTFFVISHQSMYACIINMHHLRGTDIVSRKYRFVNDIRL